MSTVVPSYGSARILLYVRLSSLTLSPVRLESLTYTRYPMRRFSLAFFAISLCAFLSSLLVLGCGGKKDDDSDDDAPRSKKKPRDTGPVVAAPTLKKVEAKEYGTLTGKVALDGDPSGAIAELKASIKSSIDANTDASFCLTGEKSGVKSPIPVDPLETTEQEYRVGANKCLGNVFVWIEPQQGYYFDIPKDQLDAVPKEVTMYQPHCAFLPHCCVVFPSYYKDGKQEPTGQKLVMENDALVLHNAKITSEKDNPPSLGIAPGKRQDYLFHPQKGAVNIACDVHKFMKSYVRVHDHPYATVTSVGANHADLKKRVWENADSQDFGTYAIKGVPVGATVKVFAWHEKAGWLTPASGETLVLTKETKKDFTAMPK